MKLNVISRQGSSISLVVREAQVTIRQHFTPTSLAIINSNNKRNWKITSDGDDLESSYMVGM